MFFPVEECVLQTEGKSPQLPRQLNSKKSCSNTIGGEFFRKLMQKLSSSGAASPECWKAYLSAPVVRSLLYHEIIGNFYKNFGVGFEDSQEFLINLKKLWKSWKYSEIFYKKCKKISEQWMKFGKKYLQNFFVNVAKIWRKFFTFLQFKGVRNWQLFYDTIADKRACLFNYLLSTK